MRDLDQNKETVRAFYELAFNDKKPEEAIARYVGSKYIQHNPMAGDGPGPFVELPIPAEWPSPRQAEPAINAAVVSDHNSPNTKPVLIVSDIRMATERSQAVRPAGQDRRDRPGGRPQHRHPRPAG
jgi:hypothetical protein